MIQEKKESGVVFRSSEDKAIDNSLRADIVDRAPSQAAVIAALVKKQEKIESTDEIKEGKDHLYFTPQRAIGAVAGLVIDAIDKEIVHKQDRINSSDDIKEGQDHQYFKPDRAIAAVLEHVDTEISKALSLKQNPISSADDIKEGKEHLYYSDLRARLAAMAVCPTFDMVKKAVEAKQDVIRSSDDIAEGMNHKFFDTYHVKMLIEATLVPYQEQINTLATLCKHLQAQVDELKPKWSDQFEGGNGSLNICVGLTQHGAKWQTLVFEKGMLKVVEPVSAPKKIGPTD